MPAITPKQLGALQKDPDNIRNICILAHIDHGKTTLSDCLIASNGIISSKLAGKVRYLDNREDEQQRGITMKSSAISLLFNVISQDETREYLVNLIDSPGHVDFSSEVSTATRLCDGALVLVDCIEGVGTQTITVLRQAWIENVKPCLVFNKIDRLIVEWRLSPMEAYQHLKNLIEQVNAQMGSLFAAHLAEELNRAPTSGQADGDSSAPEFDFEEVDDSSIYFAPERGNVVFASAADGWAFRVFEFASLYSRKLGIREATLRKTLWGDYYLDPKAKRVVNAEAAKGRLKPMFVQFVLENIWAVYEATILNHNPEKIEKIVNALGLKIVPKELKTKDTKSLVQTIMSKWLPLAPATLLMVAEQLPSPKEAQRNRFKAVIYGNKQNPPFKNEEIERGIMECDASEAAHTTAFISKMVAVPVDALPSNRRVQLTPEELRERRRKKMEMDAARAAAGPGQDMVAFTPGTTEAVPATAKEEQEEAAAPRSEAFVGFGRVFSGTVKKGQEIFVLGPKYSPQEPQAHCTKVRLTSVYLLMGKELEELEEVPAGNIFGVLGLEEVVLKSATLSTSLACPSFGQLYFEASPIVRVAIEPTNPAQLPQLLEGLRLLNQADPCVEISVQETGEHIIATAGELHLERCIKDLRERFAKIEIEHSAPIVPFRETVVLRTPQEASGDVVTLTTPDKQAKISVRAYPLPREILDLIEESNKPGGPLRLLLDRQDLDDSTDQAGAGPNQAQTQAEEDQISSFLDRLRSAFQVAGPRWRGCFDRILSFGPKRVGPNLLIWNTSQISAKPWFQGSSSRSGSSIGLARGKEEEEEEETLHSYDYLSSLISGFQLATLAGPLCEEPVMGVAFFVDEFEVLRSPDTKPVTGGQFISLSKECMRQAFLARSPRLMLANYSCDIQADGEVLGKVYGVISKRKGKVLSEEMKEGTSIFIIKATLPVVESFGFADEIRTKTSGLASPQLVFSGWETFEEDPFWVPTTEEELEDLGQKADRENVALRYMVTVRKRKGLAVQEKITENPEKQSTLKR